MLFVRPIIFAREHAIDIHIHPCLSVVQSRNGTSYQCKNTSQENDFFTWNLNIATFNGVSWCSTGTLLDQHSDYCSDCRSMRTQFRIFIMFHSRRTFFDALHICVVTWNTFICTFRKYTFLVTIMDRYVEIIFFFLYIHTQCEDPMFVKPSQYILRVHIGKKCHIKIDLVSSLCSCMLSYISTNIISEIFKV